MRSRRSCSTIRWRVTATSNGTTPESPAASTSKTIRRPARPARRTTITAAGAASRRCGRFSGTSTTTWPTPTTRVALGFTPIWNVLTGRAAQTHRHSPPSSASSPALKAQNAGSAAAINTLVAAQNIDASNIDIYGTSETHSPTEVPANAALPVYTLATIGGPAVVVRTSDDAGHHNKLGDRRFVRFTLNTTRNVTITASSSNPNTSGHRLSRVSQRPARQVGNQPSRTE